MAKYECLLCNCINDEEAWADATQKDFGGKICSLKECNDYIEEHNPPLDNDLYTHDHTCPDCGHTSYTKDIRKVEK